MLTTVRNGSLIRLGLQIGAVLVSASIASAQNAAPRPIVGAIRWDAWTGGKVTEQVEQTLAPQKYHYRLPWFAKVIDDDRVSIDGSPQAIMDREIDFAADAGLDYWAFLVYGADNELSRSLRNYLASARRERIKFCMILKSTLADKNAQQWPEECKRAVALLGERGYQTVLGGRPLVYVFGSGAQQKARLTEFRRAAIKTGHNPYLVFMGWDMANDLDRHRDEGFEAVSAYAMASTRSAFSELAHSTESAWQAAIKTHSPCVPLVTTGWDKRPRQDHPVKWELGDAYHRQKVFPSTATPDEIAAHLNHAITFVQSHPTECAANAIIVYAWNEHDEGGWLSPTWTPGGNPDTARLDAIREILRPSK